MNTRSIWVISLLFAGTLGAVYTDYDSAKQKLDKIESDRLHSGTRVELTAREMTAWAEREAPQGVRNPRIQLVAPEVASGSALVDFNKLQRAQGYEPGWLMSKLLNGERPVSVTARIRSANRHATVDVQKVEISGVTIDGKTLDFLIQSFLLPLYPDAAVGRPFELGHRIDRLDVQPASVGVLIGR
ncbi:MAG TPA: hypothetical protein VGZ73_22680 [Bryobacteraceae bacterium]|nr:hypothetical protein [Bryobacteraceae bacterium]